SSGAAGWRWLWRRGDSLKSGCGPQVWTEVLAPGTVEGLAPRTLKAGGDCRRGKQHPRPRNPAELANTSARRRVPEEHLPLVGAGGQPVAVRAEGHGERPPGGNLEAEQFLAARRLPEADGPVPAGRGQALAVRAE